jgi:hypothetical protein
MTGGVSFKPFYEKAAFKIYSKRDFYYRLCLAFGNINSLPGLFKDQAAAPQLKSQLN